MTSACAIWTAFLLQATSPAPATVPAAAPFELPPGPAAEAVALILPATSAHATPADLGAPNTVPAYAPDAWSKPATWSAWGSLVSAEKVASRGASAKPPDAERRARLALLALEQGRSDAAWGHLAATSSDPTWTAAILPRFLPGVPRGSRCTSGGLVAALPDGVVLAPSLPPPTRSTDDGRVDRRAMSARAIGVGAAIVSMRVSVENEGVQIDVRHVSGGPAHLSVLLPEQPGFAFANEYVDWYRQDDMRVPHAIEVKPGEEEHTIYGRFEPGERRFTANVPKELPAPISLGGLWLVAPKDADRPLLAGVAQALSGVLGVECKLRAPGDPPPWTGTFVDFVDPAARSAKLAWLTSAVERFALAQPAPH